MLVAACESAGQHADADEESNEVGRRVEQEAYGLFRSKPSQHQRSRELARIFARVLIGERATTRSELVRLLAVLVQSAVKPGYHLLSVVHVLVLSNFFGTMRADKSIMGPVGATPAPVRADLKTIADSVMWHVRVPAEDSSYIRRASAASAGVQGKPKR